MPTVVHGDFEWDDDKAASNAAKHGVTFDEAALAMRDVLSVDFEDAVQPTHLVTLAASPDGRILYMSPPRERTASVSSTRASPHAMNDESMKSVTEPSEPSEPALEEMPEIDEQRFRRRPGRGHHVNRSVGEIVVIEAELWAHFGSAQAVNDALRRVVDDAKKAAGS